METIAVILGIIGLATGNRSPPQYYQPMQQTVQEYYDPQTGKRYLYFQGQWYGQNVSQNQGYQNQSPQGVATPNWAPQPPNGQWYPQQPATAAAYPQGYYR